MTRPSTRSIIVAVLFFVLCLLVTFPASVASKIVSSQNPNVKLYGVSGTLWSGRAQQVSVNTAGVPIELGATQWRLSASSLLLLKLKLNVTADRPSQHIDANIAVGIGGSVSSDHLRAEIPVGLIRNWLPLALNGQLFLRVSELKWADNQLQTLVGQTQLQQLWVDMGSSQQMLGDYRIDWSTDKTEISGLISSDKASAMPVNGSVRLDQSTKRYQINATANFPADFPQNITQSIAMWGKRSGNTVAINRQGNL